MRFSPIAILFAATVLLAPAASAAGCAGAGTVKAAAASFMSAARSGSAGAFSSALSRHADVQGLALNALGQYRKQLPAARRAEYLRNAHRFMSGFLADNAGRFGGAAISVEGCRGGLVETTAGGREIVWRVSGGRIQDVRVGGVWLAPQLKSKFTGIIRKGDGKVETLLDFLARRKVAAK